ncbi:hypothetical protein PRIC1_013625 [Phytophthora ramorum]
MPIHSESRATPRSDATNQDEQQTSVPTSGLFFSLEKTESDEEEEEQQDQRSLARTHGPAEAREKRPWETESRQQLLQRTRNRIRRSSLQLQQLDANGGSAVVAASGDDFAEEIESEAAEIRTLIARTTQLWSAVDRAERAEDVAQPLQLQASRSFSASALQTRRASLPAQYLCAENEDSTLGSEEEYAEEDDDTETESVGEMPLQHMNHDGGYATDDELFVAPLRHSRGTPVRSPGRMVELRRLEQGELDGTNSDGGHESEGSEEEGYEMEHTTGDLQGELMDASNRAINASKARAIKNAMLGNLIRLGFRDSITRAALEAGVLEIDHYDSDCELAYVDIFMSLVKMVCDAHVEVVNESDDADQSWVSPGRPSDDHDIAGSLNASTTYSLEQRSFLPFKWPVFDMAQFEFGNARPGTCFNSVCVLTNLPKVSMDRTEELMEVLSCNLFCMIGDPIQVVIPSASSTGRTKGHAFLEFDDPDMAKSCAAAVDGLTWGRGPFGRIRGNLFRQYQVKSPAEEQRRAPAMVNDEASFRRSFSGAPVSGSFPGGPTPAYERHGSGLSNRFRPGMEQNGISQQQNLFCESDEDSSDGGEWVVGRPLEYAPFNSSPLLDLSSGSVDIRDQYAPGHHDGVAQQVDWDDEALGGGYAVHLSSEEEDGIEYDESFDSNSALELQAPDEEKVMDPSLFDELVRECRYSDSRCSPTRVSFSSGETQAESSTVTPTASAVARETLADCGMVEQPWDASHEVENGAEKPWRRYCEELIVRNREMQDQVAFARRRIAQLSHNNQKLHLLIDRVERDRDGLLFENDLLQTQLHGYEDHEQDQVSMMKELVMLRKRLNQKEHSIDSRSLDQHHHLQAAYVSASLLNPSSLLHGVRSALSHLSASTLANCKMEELKEWEQLLESTLSHVRSVKEEKALEMQKKLDRQVEEQNELKLCVICLSNEKSILCLPCRHLCLCKTCSSRQEVTKCPICRLEIEEMLAVYS